METLPNRQERENPPLVASSTASSAGSNAVVAAAPLTPRSAQRQVDPGSYPTTFVQADTSSFKQVVQMLTGSAETAAAAAVGQPLSPRSPPAAPASTAKNMIPPPGKSTGPKKPAFKLYERRGSLRNLKAISPLMPSFAAGVGMAGATSVFSPRKQAEILSPSTLDFPSLILSPVTPLIPDPFNRSPHPPPPPPPLGSAAALSAEDRAIAEKGFYLHPSPRSDAEPPRLLSLFPETSPRLTPPSFSP